MIIKIVGKKKAVQSALTRMCREVWAYEHMRHRQIGEYAYLASLIQTGEVLEKRFPALNHGKRRAARWAGR